MELSVIIATSFNRKEFLFERSLFSIYKQYHNSPELILVYIIDDNPKTESQYSTEFPKIQRGVLELRAKLGIPSTHFPTKVIPNIRTQGNSGTGAWNTGIFLSHSLSPNGYISILDDDDEYLPNHLADCIKVCSSNTAAVFQELQWKNTDGTVLNFPLSDEVINPSSFFKGNPGVQGSNMFFKTQFLVDIGGFDETFPNTTDRELLIRFLWHVSKLKAESGKRYKVEVLKNLGVIHYNHSFQKVNNNLSLKQIGLDLFYKKYKSYFSEEDYSISIRRAKQLFNYNV